jgi:TonB-dependent starch-binding outer membrane protein SusC
MTLGYTLPSSTKFAKMMHISSLRIYASVYNVFTLTKYSGLDPEVSTNDSMNDNYPTPGIDYGAYPRARSFVLGLNLGF